MLSFSCATLLTILVLKRRVLEILVAKPRISSSSDVSSSSVHSVKMSTELCVLASGRASSTGMSMFGRVETVDFTPAKIWKREGVVAENPSVGLGLPSVPER